MDAVLLTGFASNAKGDSMLDIEVDGEMYHKDWNGELSYRDQLRNQRLFELGWDVKRFWVYEIRDNLLLVKEALCKSGYINQLMSAISHILQNSHCENVEIRLHPLLKDELTSFNGATIPFSVMWQPSETTNQCNTNRYHGFAFD